MNLETFVLKCQEHINGEFDKLACGDHYIETDRGKLRIEYSPYANDNVVDKVTFTAPGITLEMRPLRGAQGEIDYEHVLMHLAFAIITRYEARKIEIKRIEELIAQLETIRKTEVFYKWHHDLRPRVEVILDGTDMVLFNVFGSGIKYQPSRTALGGLFRRVGHEVTAQNVADIMAVPITEYERIMERRCGSRRMDIFVSENVRYVAPEADDSDFGWIEVGDKNKFNSPKRIRPERMVSELVNTIAEHPAFADIRLRPVGGVETVIHTAEPMKGLIATAELRVKSDDDPEFALWFRVYDNAHVTCTCALNDISNQAVAIIEQHMRPIQLEA
jgi:hypothetical protein